MNREHELELRLAESRHTEAELRRVIDVLLSAGDTVFASRSWRMGRVLSRGLEILPRLFGRPLPAAQDAAHWRAIVAAHDAALVRRRALLERLCVDGSCEDLDAVLAELWRHAQAEHGAAPP
ncbi:MAG: hypothetical protein JNN30_16440 [Rhodanobacteraceae bacterium]|nr:hypothetical protein [Rhodanobacteraceae bacterium]